MQILIADDDLTSRSMLVAISKKWGYTPIVAEDGEAAWQILQENEAPLLLLIDWEMPKLNGLDLCRRIRLELKNVIPFIILLTARSGTDDVVAGLEAGANDYIAKPFASAELQARLQVGKRMLELQAELNKTKNVLTYEREVIENIILKMREATPFDETQLRTLEIPVENISGDVLLSAFKPDGTRHIMLGDFTGHGLTAAIAGPAVNDIFYSMTKKNQSLLSIANEINQQLIAKLPTGLFLGAIFIELNPDKSNLTIWNCGMSDVLIYRKFSLWKTIKSSLLALGIIKQEFISAAKLKVEPCDRVYAYSDGITETINSSKEEFGSDRLNQAIHELLLNDEDINFLNQKANQFRGDMEQLDDITLLELSC